MHLNNNKFTDNLKKNFWARYDQGLRATYNVMLLYPFSGLLLFVRSFGNQK